MEMSRRSQEKTAPEKASQYDVLSPLLNSMYDEFQELSKKKPDGQVGKTKVMMVNRLLKGIHQILGSEDAFEYLDVLDEDSLPQNSDVVLILGQTKAAMKTFRERYFNRSIDQWIV
jgi:hypothetical protein